MALKILMLRKRLTEEEKNNAALRAKLASFAQREKELERSIEEASTDEERSTVQAAVETFESEREAARQAVTASESGFVVPFGSATRRIGVLYADRNGRPLDEESWRAVQHFALQASLAVALCAADGGLG